MIIQYPTHFVYKLFVNQEDESNANQHEESDSESEYEMEDNEDYASEYDSEEEDEEANFVKIARVPMVLDSQGHIYFV